MNPTEDQIRLAAKLYDCRDTARRLLGKQYHDRLRPIQDALRGLARKQNKDILKVAMEAAGRVDGIERIIVIAAAVECTEPSPAT